MSEFKGTPGPWFIEAYAGEHDEAGAVISADIGKRIASTWGIWFQAGAPVWAEYYANARLIAAAPELLKACQELVAMTRYEDHRNGVEYNGIDEGETIAGRIIADADDAIAKALGDE